MTDLLTTAALTLQEAKASGGDAIRFAGQDAEPEPETRTFDVYQGLIFAVDTKDRYTKRHSGDVARYSVFLAEQMDAEPEFIQTIRVAGLLHDVGKIGIPDHILRKPGKLTSEEYEIVQQHVVLGDLIVRDLPDIELIRAGGPPPSRALGRDRLRRPAGRHRHPATSRGSWRSRTPSRR